MDFTLCLLFTWGQMGEECLSIYIRLHLVYQEKHKAVISKVDCFSFKVHLTLAYSNQQGYFRSASFIAPDSHRLVEYMKVHLFLLSVPQVGTELVENRCLNLLLPLFGTGY